MTDLLKDLEAVALLAEKATPGEWKGYRAQKYTHLKSETGDYVMEARLRGEVRNPPDATYIAALHNLYRTHHAEIAGAVADAAKWKKVEAVVAMAEDESDGQINTACGLLLIDRAASVNAGKMELKFSGVTGKNDAELGDWVVTVAKAIDAQHNSAREG